MNADLPITYMTNNEKKKEGKCKEMRKMYSFIFYGLY